MQSNTGGTTVVHDIDSDSCETVSSTHHVHSSTVSDVSGGMEVVESDIELSSEDDVEISTLRAHSLPIPETVTAPTTSELFDLMILGVPLICIRMLPYIAKLVEALTFACS